MSTLLHSNSVLHTSHAVLSSDVQGHRSAVVHGSDTALQHILAAISVQFHLSTGGGSKGSNQALHIGAIGHVDSDVTAGDAAADLASQREAQDVGVSAGIGIGQLESILGVRVLGRASQTVFSTHQESVDLLALGLTSAINLHFVIVAADKNQTPVISVLGFRNAISIYIAIGVNGTLRIFIAIGGGIGAGILAQIEGDEHSLFNIQVIFINGQAVRNGASDLVSSDGEVIEGAHRQGLQLCLILSKIGLLNDFIGDTVRRNLLSSVSKIIASVDLNIIIRVLILVQDSITGYFLRQNQDLIAAVVVRLTIGEGTVSCNHRGSQLILVYIVGQRGKQHVIFIGICSFPNKCNAIVFHLIGGNNVLPPFLLRIILQAGRNQSGHSGVGQVSVGLHVGIKGVLISDCAESRLIIQIGLSSELQISQSHVSRSRICQLDDLGKLSFQNFHWKTGN
ncbi:unknown [Firmicutes bacterium CAG:94]|nr:unknown [Firmicutes bacterium CAG:94]